MTLLSHYRIPLIITVLAAMVALLWESPWSSLLALLIIALVWVSYGFCWLNQATQYRLMVERVSLLKTFSIELQQLVDKELGLVQGDVMRIRDIVSDSIGILQHNVNQIYECSAFQYEQLTMLAQQQQTAVLDPEYSRHLTRVVNEVIDKVREAAKTVACAERAAKQTTLLADALWLESAQVDSACPSMVKSAQEIKTIAGGLTLRGSEIQQGADKIKATLQQLQHWQQPGSVTTGPESNTIIAAVSNRQALIGASAQEIIRALQFEDIVSQISARVAGHIGDIRMAVALLSRLCESELSANFSDELMQMQQEFVMLRQKLETASAKAVVAQKNMDEGDVELF